MSPIHWQPSESRDGSSSGTGSSRPIRHAELPPGANLKAALATERERLIVEGWRADELERYAFCFCERGNERVCISIECYEPGKAGLGHG